MAEVTPRAIVIAGPNGAGKPTSAPSVLRDVMGVAEFLNADVIARGLSAFEPERAAMAAGRVMLARLRELAGRRESFAFETTPASRSFAPWLAELKATDYTTLSFSGCPVLMPPRPVSPSVCLTEGMMCRRRRSGADTRRDSGIFSGYISLWRTRGGYIMVNLPGDRRWSQPDQDAMSGR
jgi:hypothetical protein